MNRGDVVLVDFPFTDGTASKIRPALVVQNDIDNARYRDTILALITGNVSRSTETTQLLVDPATPEGASSGLHGPSAILCRHLYATRQSLVINTIGKLADTVMQKVNECLKAALDIQ